MGLNWDGARADDRGGLTAGSPHGPGASGMEAATTKTVPRPAGRWRRLALPVAVFVILASVTVALAAVTRRVVDDQERRLLEEQTAAAGTVVDSLFSGFEPTLSLLGAIAGGETGGLFDAIAGGVASDDGQSVGMAVRRGDGFVVTRSVGAGPEVGSSLGGVHLAVAERAATADGMVTEVLRDPDRVELLVGVASPLSDDTVVYSSFVFDPSLMFQREDDSPFRELLGALYVGERVDPERLVLATSDELPIEGSPMVTERLTIGADPWLLVATSRRPLVGSLASALPRLVFAVGGLTALLLGGLIFSITRRRAYALRLVEERTRELRAALAEKEQLEEGQRVARIAAEEANRSKSEFLSRMSHELRTPLNAVLGFAQLLETEELDDDGRDSVQQILKGGRHLLALINEVLDITRIESGSFQLSPEPVLVSDVVDDVLELTRPLAAEANVQLLAGVNAGAGVHVLADRQRLKQILLNLVGNAIKYNQPGGSVVVLWEPVEPARLCLRVHDTGPGIRPEQLELLFTPFERLGAEQTSVEGTGVGLALSRRLAEAMGASIEVESVVGQGSTFSVELPIVEAPLDRFERLHPDASEPPPDAAPRAKVLYVEDNLPNLRLVERIVDRHGAFELISATHGRLGFELAREARPALILLDLHLPDLDGDEVLRMLRDDPATTAIPVVVVSADATASQVKRLVAQGATAYLTKPLDVQRLDELLESLAGAST